MLLRLLGIFFLSLTLMTHSAVQAVPKESVPAERKQIQQKSVRSSSKKVSMPAERKRIQKKSIRSSSKKVSVPVERKRIQQKSVRSYSKKESVPAERKQLQNKPARSSSQLQKLKMISKGSAINIAKRTVNGKVLSARMMSSAGSNVYGVKILVGDSRVRTVYVDGESGRVIRVNKD